MKVLLSMKADLASVKQDMATMQEDIAEIKTSQDQLKTKVDDIDGRMNTFESEVTTGDNCIKNKLVSRWQLYVGLKFQLLKRNSTASILYNVVEGEN